MHLIGCITKTWLEKLKKSPKLKMGLIQKFLQLEGLKVERNQISYIQKHMRNSRAIGGVNCARVVPFRCFYLPIKFEPQTQL